MAVIAVCDRCGGSGKIVTRLAPNRAEKLPCGDCDGFGRVILDDSHPILKEGDN